jgi:hypothetical protein
MSLLSLFFFELVDRMLSIEYMYSSGVFLALLVFAATYFHRQIGLMTLLLVSLICAQDFSTSEMSQQAVKEAGLNYIAHWNFSCQLTFVLSVLLFFTAIILKRKLKQKNKLN